MWSFSDMSHAVKPNIAFLSLLFTASAATRGRSQSRGEWYCSFTNLCFLQYDSECVSLAGINHFKCRVVRWATWIYINADVNNICVSNCLSKLGVKFDPSEVHGDLDCVRKEDLLLPVHCCKLSPSMFCDLSLMFTLIVFMFLLLRSVLQTVRPYPEMISCC